MWKACHYSLKYMNILHKHRIPNTYTNTYENTIKILVEYWTHFEVRAILNKITLLCKNIEEQHIQIYYDFVVVVVIVDINKQTKLNTWNV